MENFHGNTASECVFVHKCITVCNVKKGFLKIIAKEKAKETEIIKNRECFPKRGMYHYSKKEIQLWAKK